MPILAFSSTALAHITDILHDMHFALPSKNLCPIDETLTMTLTDQELILREERVSEFELRIFEVIKTEVEGKLENCPDPVMLDQIDWKPKKNLLVIKPVHPVQITCEVRRLHLELEQTA